MNIFNQRQRMRSRKGSLQISINAIVILVMAMVVLGLGLGFIRNLIGTGQDQLGRAMRNAELENPASADNPITVDKLVTFKSGDSGVIHVGYYNELPTTVTANPGGAAGDILCQYEAGGNPVPFILSAPEATVEGGSSQGWQGIIRPQGGASALPGKYTCPIVIYQGGNVLKSTSTIIQITK